MSIGSIGSSNGNIGITTVSGTEGNLKGHSLKQVLGGQGTCVEPLSITPLNIPQKTFSDYHITVAHSAGV